MIVKRGKERLNILFISEYFYPRAAGGEVWSFELCTALAAQGHDITVMTCRHDDAPMEEKTLGVRILRPIHTTANEQQRVARKIAARRLLRHVERYVREHREEIDAVHVMAYTMNVGVSSICERLRIPCVTSVHSYFGKSWSRVSRMGPLLRALERRTIRDDRSMALHVPSRHLRQLIKHDTGHECVVIHNWLPDTFPRQKRTPGLLFVGSLEPIKNPLACIPVAKRLAMPLTVIGKGSLETRLRDAASREGVRITIMHNVPRKETLARIAGADMVLVPSVEESFSLVALEAIAQGTPVSGTPVGIIPELPGVVAWPPTRAQKRVAERTQRVVRNAYTRDHAVRQMLKLYRNLISRR